ncbi:MAG TPA: HEAT repeat domain-containing protein [Acidobacteriota bacterium]|nr:HEAT repeat domain-containing protein [Acidobacteriota bacterium]
MRIRIALGVHLGMSLVSVAAFGGEAWSSSSIEPVSLQADYYQDFWKDIDEEAVQQRLTDLVEEALIEGLDKLSLDVIWSERGREIRSYGIVAVQCLSRLAESPERGRRLAAIRFLDRIGGDLAAPALIQAARNESDPDLRLEALQRVVEHNGYLEVSWLLNAITEKEAAGKILEYAQEVMLQRGEFEALAQGGEPIAQISGGVARRPDPANPERVRRRIEEIMAEVIESGTIILPEGVKAITRPHPSAAHYREVLEMGPAAIPPLVDYAKGGGPFEWWAAKWLVMALGGKEIVAPLSEIVLDTSLPNRHTALASLVEGTSYLSISKLLREIALEGDSPSSRYARGVLQAASA